VPAEAVKPIVYAHQDNEAADLADGVDEMADLLMDHEKRALPGFVWVNLGATGNTKPTGGDREGLRDHVSYVL